MDNAEARQDLVRLTGQMAVPVITVDDQVIRGFDKARLKSLLAL
jgi:glutaredoxin